MKESITLWKREFVFPWKSKLNLARGGARRLPKTLSSMQIILICGFASILLLSNAVTSGSFSWLIEVTPEIEPGPHSLASFTSPKRTIAQIKENSLQLEKDIAVIEEEKVNADDEKKIKDDEAKELKNPGLPEKKSETEQEQNEIFQQQRKLEAEVIKIKDDEAKEVKNPELPEKKTETKQKQNEISQQQRKLEAEAEVKIEDDGAKEVTNPEVLEKSKKSEPEQVLEQNEILQQQRKLEGAEVKKEDKYMPTWMPPGMEVKTLGPNPKNWDQQRAAWLDKNPQMKLNADGKQRMLLVTGSSPWACSNPVGDHYYLKYIKNKMDYCRQHNIEIFYNLAHLDKDMDIFWAKLPIVRTLMLNHPEIEWFFWMDADAIFTDMLFEIPLDNYKDHNLVMWGYDSGFYGEKSWVAINAGVFLLRNCQWSLDLFDMWAPMGPKGPVRDEVGKLLTAYMSRRDEAPADDQSALGYLILTKPELQPKVRLEEDYELSGYWVDHVEHYEEHMTKDHPGLGDKRWPFITHFTGCSVCSGNSNPLYDELNCQKHMERAFNFADNQVLQPLGFQHESLESCSVKRIKEQTDHPLDNVGPNTWLTPSESYGL